MSEGACAALAWCPFPDADSARVAIDVLLDERLIACANLIGGFESHYVWQGQREHAQEVGVLLKTDARLMESLVSRLTALHPYGEPAILAWRCDGGAPATLAWLAGLVTGREGA